MEFLKEFGEFTLDHHALYLIIIMSIFTSIIILVLNYIKKPIKKLTAKIENENLRHLANKVIIILSFALAVGLWYTLHAIYPEVIKINWFEILLTGVLPVFVYAFFDGVLTTSGAKSIVYTIKEISSDGKITLEEAGRVAKEIGDIFTADIIKKSEEKGKEPYFGEDEPITQVVEEVKIVAKTEDSKSALDELLASMK